MRFLIVLLTLLYSVIAIGQNCVEFDKPEYVFNCSVPPAYEYFGVNINMEGPMWPAEGWVYFEYDAGLKVNHENLYPGDGWSRSHIVEYITHKTVPAYRDSAIAIYMKCREFPFVPPGEFCSLRFVWSSNEQCYDDTLFVRTFWRDGGSQIHWANDIGTRLIGIPNTKCDGLTWGNIKALYVNE